MYKEIILIGNPIAGGGALKKIKRAVSIIENRGYSVILLLTTKKGDAQSFAKQIVSETSRSSFTMPLVIAAGGDGTYNEVANGLVYSDIAMAILPLGTTSVLAKELKFSENINNAIDIALKGGVHKIHMGKITCRNPLDNSSITRYFLLMAGIGFDAEAVFNVNEKLKKISGKFAYILSGIKTLINYNPSPILLSYDSNKLSGYNAIIGKASSYGGNFKITPDANLKDPSFYVFLMRKKGKTNLLKQALSIILKKNRTHQESISYFRSTTIEIDGDAPIQIDGDYIGRLPAKVEIVTDALKLIY